MFARVLYFEVKPEKKEEFLKVLKNEVLPILKKQNGFLEILPLVPEKLAEEKVYTISLWNREVDAMKYEKEFYPKVFNFIEPYLRTPVTVKNFNVETTLCEHFVQAMAA